MNEDLNLVEILKDCPEGTKLYSPVFGDVEFIQCNHQSTYPILVKNKNGGINGVTPQGKAYANLDGECMLFPSKDQRDWSKFKHEELKFDPKTLKPFDRILVRANEKSIWHCCLFSHIDYDSFFPIKIAGDSYKYAVPYNDDTKHLVGTTEEAPEYYRYWDVV